MMLALLLLLLLPLPVAAQDPAAGRVLAEHWCMACHVIEREPPGTPDAVVPSFPAIVRTPSTTAESLDRYLSSGHTRMPDFKLTRDERDRLIAYILSLR
jgi:mono/diheme cytochrome c family protein